VSKYAILFWAYFLKARIVKPAETAVTDKRLANKHVFTVKIKYNNGAVFSGGPCRDVISRTVTES
jgi:hypothetical protein